MALNTYLSIITLNINGLNAPTKRHRVVQWIRKQGPYVGCLQETHFKSKDTHTDKLSNARVLLYSCLELIQFDHDALF